MLTIGHFVAKLVIVIQNIGKRRLTKKAIFRFVFLPGQELVSLFPVTGQHEQVHYQRANSSAHINIDPSEIGSMMSSAMTDRTHD